MFASSSVALKVPVPGCSQQLKLPWNRGENHLPVVEQKESVRLGALKPLPLLTRGVYPHSLPPLLLLSAFRTVEVYTTCASDHCSGSQALTCLTLLYLISGQFTLVVTFLGSSCLLGF